MSDKYYSEIALFAHALVEEGEQFTLQRCHDGWRILGDGWDAICHSDSYGGNFGYLEIAGRIVSDRIEDGVEGWVTYGEILERLGYPAREKMGVLPFSAIFKK